MRGWLTFGRADRGGVGCWDLWGSLNHGGGVVSGISSNLSRGTFAVTFLPATLAVLEMAQARLEDL